MLFRIQHLDLPDKPFFVMAANGDLTVDLNSSLFNQQSDLLGSYSYPGTLPLEPNQALIRNAHIISTSNGQRTINAMMWLGSLPFKQVKMYYTIEDNNIDYNLYYDLSLISNQLKNLKLWQIYDQANDGQLTFDNIAAMKDYMTATTTGTKGQYPMVFFPWKNDGAYIADAYVLTPKYDPAVVYNPPAKILYTNNRIYQVTATTTAGQTPVSNPEKFQDITKYPDNALPASPIINRWELADDGSSGFIVDESFPVAQTQVPAFYLVYILKRIAQYFGFTPVGDWLLEDQANNKVVMSNIPIGTVSIIPDYTFFMPDVLVSDFLKAIRTRYGLLVDVDATRGLIYFESITNLETKSEIVDLQDEQVVSFRETGTESQAFIIEGIYDDKDGAFVDSDKTNPPQLIIGDPTTAVQVSDIQMMDVETKMVQEQSAVPIYSTTPRVTNWRIPYIKMSIAGSSPMDQISELNRGDEHGFGLRFLTYHGKAEDDAGNLYPYASNDDLNPELSPIGIGTDTLVLNSITGAFLGVAAYYLYMFNSKPFEAVFELSRAKFMQLASNKRIVTKDFNFSAVNCLLDQNSADFVNNKDKVIVKLTLWPRIWPDNQAEVLPPVTVVTPPPFDNGTVYVKINFRNGSTVPTASHPVYFTFQEDIYAQFFEDAEATTPKDVIGLDVKLKISDFYDGTLTSSGIITVNCTSSSDESLLLHNAAISTPMGGHEVTHTYAIQPTTNYTIIT